MKVSIDFDGCLWSHQRFFRELMRGLQAQGHQVGMLSEHPADACTQDLALLAARGFPAPDFWYGRRAGDDRPAAEVKAEAVLWQGVDMHFDDMDFGNPLEVGLWQRVLGPEFYRVMWVTGREPVEVHYE